jgi:phosphate transport system substrate-binding protein
MSQTASDSISVCPSSSARQLAIDLVRGYAAKSTTRADRFVFANAGTEGCDVRFSVAPETPDAVVARDGIVAIVNPLNSIGRISESQLRGIFSGAIRNWSELGGAPAAIVPILPDASSDEATVLSSSLLYKVNIDQRVHRAGSSADVTRAVTGADRGSRGAIGVVAFSQAVSARVVPLTYLPPPNLLTIGTGRYPFTIRIAILAGPGRDAAAAAALINYARSTEGAGIVLKSGLVPREGL